DVLHRQHLRVPAARRAALDAEHGTEAGLAQAQDDLPVPEPQPVRQPHRRRALPLACRRGVDAGDQDQLAGLAGAPLDGVQVDLGLVATVGLDLVLAEAQLRRHVDDRPELRCLRDLDVRQHRSPLLHRPHRRRSAPDAGYCGTGGERTRSTRPSLPAMALPHRTLLLPYVRNATPSIESALARASARSRLAPLVRALGLEPRKAPIPPDARGAFALAGAEQVRGLAVIGERGGLVVLLIELAGDLTAEAVATTARRVRAHDAARPYLFLFAAQRYRRLAFASFGLDGELRHLAIERVRPRASELEALDEMVAAEGEGGVALALRRARAVDRTRVTRQFFRDFRAQRGAVGEAWTGIPADARAEREQLALLCALRLWLAMAVGSAEGEAEVSVHGEVECATFPGQSAAWPRPAHRPRASPTHSPMPTGHAPADRHITNGPPDRYASIPPLPNLDRRIRQGDALGDPLDLVAWPDGAVGGPGSLPIVAADATVRQAIRAIGPLAERYLAARPEEKPELQRRLARAEAE